MATTGRQAGSGRIVVGVDGSACSVAALAWALNAAALRDFSVDAVLVWSQEPPAVGAGMVPTPPTPYEKAREAQRARLRDIVGPLRGGAPVAVRELALKGPAARTLLTVAEGADLLVLGSHGYGPLRTTVLGSVSTACIRHARCPVVVIPQGMVTAPHEMRAAAEPTVPA